MACGLPIISSNLPFNFDILTTNNALLIDPMNVQQIADAIKQLQEHPTLQQQMSAASMAAAKDLTIQKRVGKILDFIQGKA